MVRIEQVDFLGELGRMFNARYYEELGARLTTVDDPLRAPDLLPPAGHFLVGTLDGEPIGCVGLRMMEPALFEVKHLWVDPSQRGKGAGRSLLLAAEELASRLGAERMVLDTAETLTEAIALYRSAGYIEIPPYNDNPHAQLWLEKRLSA